MLNDLVGSRNVVHKIIKIKPIKVNLSLSAILKSLSVKCTSFAKLNVITDLHVEENRKHKKSLSESTQSKRLDVPRSVS